MSYTKDIERAFNEFGRRAIVTRFGENKYWVRYFGHKLDRRTVRDIRAMYDDVYIRVEGFGMLWYPFIIGCLALGRFLRKSPMEKVKSLVSNLAYLLSLGVIGVGLWMWIDIICHNTYPGGYERMTDLTKTVIDILGRIF